MTTSFLSQFLTFYREKLLETCIGIGVIGGVSFIVFMIVTAFYATIHRDNLQLQGATPEQIGNEVVREQPQFVVEVTGAVVYPGVYTMPSDSRVQEVIQLAGGFDVKADSAVVAQQVNLAKKIEDQEKIYIPFKSEATASTPPQEVTGRTSVNSATQKQLEDLPVIGEKTAEKIISLRPYSSIDQFFEKMKLSTKSQEQLRELISL